jgi:hypothetical protein
MAYVVKVYDPLGTVPRPTADGPDPLLSNENRINE